MGAGRNNHRRRYRDSIPRIHETPRSEGLPALLHAGLFTVIAAAILDLNPMRRQTPSKAGRDGTIFNCTRVYNSI